jgi:hypothetical protein
MVSGFFVSGQALKLHPQKRFYAVLVASVPIPHRLERSHRAFAVWRFTIGWKALRWQDGIEPPSPEPSLAIANLLADRSQLNISTVAEL